MYGMAHLSSLQLQRYPCAPELLEAAGLDAGQTLSINISLPAAGIIGTVGSW